MIAESILFMVEGMMASICDICAREVLTVARRAGPPMVPKTCRTTSVDLFSLYLAYHASIHEKNRERPTMDYFARP